MKKYYFIILFCSVITLLQAQIVNIPDPVFKDYLVNGDYDFIGVDTNNDGEIQVSEAQAFNGNFQMSNWDGNSPIYDLTGIEAFINLNSLNMENAMISSLDTSQNLALTGIHFEGCPLITSVNVSQNTLLTSLFLESANMSLLTNLDVSQNTNLVSLGVGGSHGISTIDLSNNINLVELYFSGHYSGSIGQLTTLDLSANTSLSVIEVFNNQLTSLQLPVNVSLNSFNVSNNQLTELDVSMINRVSSEGFHCSNNPLTNLITGNAKFTSTFNCNNTLLTSLNITGDELIYFYANNNYNLQQIQFINGYATSGLSLNITADNCPNLAVICMDDTVYINEYNSVIPPQTIVTTNCSLTSGDYNQIFGAVTLDDDNDGCDANDALMSNILIQTTNGTDTLTTTTFNNGFYAQPVVEGTHTVSLIGLPDYLNYTPVTQDATFAGYNNTQTLDFCVTSSQTVNDVNVTVIPPTEARPGFDATYKLVYRNAGTTILNGDVTLEFDDAKQTFLNSNPVEDIQPFETRTIDLNFNTFPPTIVNGGDILSFTATITPNSGDYTPTDNVYVLNQTVVNSYDPNDKQVLQGEEILEEQTIEYLDYLIRFQNTGTASAINVSVTDELDSKLDWDTFQMLSASHSYEVNITNGNFVQFKFDNIYLPAEQDNEPASHGYIAFKIKPNSYRKRISCGKYISKSSIR